MQTVQFFLLTPGGQRLDSSRVLGWATSVAHRPWQHHNPLFEFALGPHQRAWLYVRADAGHSRLAVPLRLHTPMNFLLADRQQRAFYDYATGFLGFISFFSLLLFGLLRDRIYFFYGLYTLMGFFYLTTTEGYWFIWLDRPRYGFLPAVDLAELSLYGLTLAGFGFTRWYLLPSVFDHRWVRWGLRTAVGGLLVNIGLLLLNVPDWPLYRTWHTAFHLLMSSCYLSSVLLMAAIGIWLSLWPARYPEANGPARLYMLAISPAIVQVVLGFLRNNNLISDHLLIREGVVLTALLEFMILSVGLGFRYKRLTDERRRLAEETFAQGQQLLESQLKEQQNELRMAQAQLRLQEERERISRDLHDHVGAQLSVIAATETASAMGEYAREAIQSLRDTVWAIDQPELTLAEFGAKLRQYLNRQQQQHPTCTYTLDLDAPASQVLTSAQALNLFRQVQEAVHNAFKYADASRVTVHCRVEQSQLMLSVSDNGVGFDLHQPINGQPHYGLRNLQRRATELHGECEIETGPGRGTRVSVQIPLLV